MELFYSRMIKKDFCTIYYTHYRIIFFLRKREKKTRTTNLIPFIEVLFPFRGKRRMCRCIYMHSSHCVYFLVARDRSIIICKYITGKFVGELERVGKGRDTARGLFILQITTRVTPHRRWIYTWHTTPSRLCSRDKPNLFTPTLVWLVPREVNFAHKTWRSTEIIISVWAFQCLHSLQNFRLNLICENSFLCAYYSDLFLKLVERIININTQNSFYIIVNHATRNVFITFFCTIYLREF